MTIVTTRANPNHRSRPGDEGVFVLNRSTSELLHFEPVSSSNPPAHVVVPLTGLQTGAPIAVRNDLLDCRIDICSPEVPALFAENYDYADIRSDFVNGILSSDILSRKIYVHISSEGYAARVDSVRTYGAIRCGPSTGHRRELAPKEQHADIVARVRAPRACRGHVTKSQLGHYGAVELPAGAGHQFCRRQHVLVPAQARLRRGRRGSGAVLRRRRPGRPRTGHDCRREHADLAVRHWSRLQDR